MQLAKQIQCPETKWRLQGARQLACAFHRWRSLRLKKAPNASDNWLREFRKAGLEVVVGPFTLAKVQRIPLNKVELILCPVFVYTTSFHVVP